MDLIKWEERYRVGVELIDEQHQHLIELMNEFVGNFGQVGPEEIKATLEAMSEYTAYHFQSEEAALASHPELADHQREHALFLRKTLGFQQALAEGREELSLAMVQFLLSWLKNHILATDRRFFHDLQGR